MLPQIKPLEIGEYFDSHHGIYNTCNVIRLAFNNGYVDRNVSRDMTDQQMLDYEFIYDVCSDAESFLSKLCPDGYYFGSTENGDWGVYEITEE